MGGKRMVEEILRSPCLKCLLSLDRETCSMYCSVLQEYRRKIEISPYYQSKRHHLSSQRLLEATPSTRHVLKDGDESIELCLA